MTISGALSASADTKTGDGLAAYAMTAYNEGWQYVWGGASYGAVDCSGLIYSYVGGGARVTEDMLYSSPESGYVSNGVPDIPGIGLWQPGHVGVYVGGGMAVDARNEEYDVCYSAVSSKSWVMWFKVAGVSYGSSSVTNDNNVENTVSSDNSTDTSYSTVLKKGDQGPSVNELQERLKELGYFTDNTTYYFGNVTEAALKDFQAAAGLSATGICDEATRKALFADDAPVKYVDEESDSEEFVYEEMTDSDTFDSEYDKENSDYEYTSSDSSNDSDNSDSYFADIEDNSTDSDTTEDIDTDVLYEQGDEDNEICNIQFILVLLKYFDFDITGYFCDNTAEAVAQFQRDNGLVVTGSIDKETYLTIYEKYENRDSSDTSDSDTAVDTDTELDSDIIIDTDEADVENYGYLNPGMTGEEVAYMQQKLIDLRYLIGDVSGVYDDDTVQAVRYFQEIAGYDTSDYITEEQATLLYSSEAPQSPDYSYLQLGYRGKDVEDLQKALVVWGYLSYGEISELGYYDYATEDAVISAQQMFNLEASGVVTPELTAVLKTNLQDSTNGTESSTDTNTNTTNSTTSTDNSSANENTASENKTEAVTSSSNTSTVSEAPAVDVPKTGNIDLLASKSFAFAAIVVSLLVLLFAFTIHYWNVSMEKRHRRARKAMTVSVYRRR